MYCEITGWYTDDTGTITNHRKKADHTVPMQQYTAAEAAGKTGRLTKRGSVDEKKALWSWEIVEAGDNDGGGGGGGAAAAAASSFSSSSVSSMSSTWATTGSEGSSSANNVGDKSTRPGDRWWANKPLASDEQRQSFWNRLCGWIARDARPFNMLQGVGFQAFKDWANSGW